MDEKLDDKIKDISWKLLKHRKHQEAATLGDRTEVDELREEVDQLRNEVKSMSQSRAASPPTESDLIYQFHKGELERDHMDEIVAFDIDTKEIAGYGNNMKEAYDNARKKTGKNQFYFKRVGSKYLHRL